MVPVEYGTPRNYPRPVKTGPKTWKLNDRDYHWDDHIHPCPGQIPVRKTAMKFWAYMSEEDFERKVKAEANLPLPTANMDLLARFERLQKLADAKGLKPVYMAEVGAGTAAAQYPTCMWMWMMEDDDLYWQWLKRKRAYGLAMTEEYLKRRLHGGFWAAMSAPTTAP